jgi:hypothetical protein
MNALLKHQLLNASIDADKRGLTVMACILTDALAEIERLAEFEPLTLFTKEPIVSCLHVVASECTDDLAARIDYALCARCGKCTAVRGL